MRTSNLILALIAAFSLALTPAEKKIVQQARTELKKAQTEYAAAKAETAQAKLENEASAQHAKDTEDRIAPLSAQIEASHKNEQNLANRVAPLQAFWDSCHRLWGAMGIVVCFGILAKHILILIGAIILLVLILWALSFAFPVLRPIFAIIEAFVKSVFSKIGGLFKKKTP